MTFSCQPIAIGSLPVGQFALLRKLALLRLTALLERHTSSSKPSFGWDLPKFMRKIKSPDYKGQFFYRFVKHFGTMLMVILFHSIQNRQEHVWRSAFSDGPEDGRSPTETNTISFALPPPIGAGSSRSLPQIGRPFTHRQTQRIVRSVGVAMFRPKWLQRRGPSGRFQ
jgi:hypothetical protein